MTAVLWYLSCYREVGSVARSQPPPSSLGDTAGGLRGGDAAKIQFPILPQEQLTVTGYMPLMSQAAIIAEVMSFFSEGS